MSCYSTDCRKGQTRSSKEDQELSWKITFGPIASRLNAPGLGIVFSRNCFPLALRINLIFHTNLLLGSIQLQESKRHSEKWNCMSPFYVEALRSSFLIIFVNHCMTWGNPSSSRQIILDHSAWNLGTIVEGQTRCQGSHNSIRSVLEALVKWSRIVSLVWIIFAFWSLSKFGRILTISFSYCKK